MLCETACPTQNAQATWVCGPQHMHVWEEKGFFTKIKTTRNPPTTNAGELQASPGPGVPAPPRPGAAQACRNRTRRLRPRPRLLCDVAERAVEPGRDLLAPRGRATPAARPRRGRRAREAETETGSVPAPWPFPGGGERRAGPGEGGETPASTSCPLRSPGSGAPTRPRGPSAGGSARGRVQGRPSLFDKRCVAGIGWPGRDAGNNKGGVGRN